MIIEQNLIEDDNILVKIDTENKIIYFSKNQQNNDNINDSIPFEKISYLFLKIGSKIGTNDYIEFHPKKQSSFSIHIKQEQVKELEKFFNIRKKILQKTYPIKKNHKYLLSVSEPWDFNGNIIGTALDVNEERIIFKSDNKIKIQGVSGNVFMLRSRFSDENCKELPLHVNAAIILSDYDSTKTDEQLLKNSKFVIIGSLEECNLLRLLLHYVHYSFLYFVLFLLIFMLFKPILNILHLFIK